MAPDISNRKIDCRPACIVRNALREVFFIGCMIAVCFLFAGKKADAWEYQVKGQLSGWGIESECDGAWNARFGLRYIPELTVGKYPSEDTVFDVEASLNGFMAHDTRESMDEADVDLYRLKFRWADAKTEIRLGLQKISFGPAFLLRPLQWFDRIDPRDPLHLTEGVYAALFKYTAMNSANYWIWILLGNDDPKGIDILPSDPDRPEIGGRFQFPVLHGEMAIACHRRQVDLSPYFVSDYPEQRLALDGRWDVGVGLWFEAVAQRQEIDFFPYEWLKLCTVGMDYTVNIGNGIHILGEHLVASLAETFPDWKQNYHYGAFLVDYPATVFDVFSYIGYYDWDRNDFAQYGSWQRTYDKVVVSLSLFRYPEADERIFSFQPSSGGFGAGGQVMIIYNH
jgi:hypothetical protein